MMSNLRDAFYTLRLALSSQKYCGITPYYGSPTYHYLCMGMGISVSPQIWQQFVDLVFQDDQDDLPNCSIQSLTNGNA